MGGLKGLPFLVTTELKVLFAWHLILHVFQLLGSLFQNRSWGKNNPKHQALLFLPFSDFGPIILQYLSGSLKVSDFRSILLSIYIHIHTHTRLQISHSFSSSQWGDRSNLTTLTGNDTFIFHHALYPITLLNLLFKKIYSP